MTDSPHYRPSSDDPWAAPLTFSCGHREGQHKGDRASVNCPGAYPCCKHCPVFGQVRHQHASACSRCHWVPFGSHADTSPCPFTGKLQFGLDGPDGLPDWERHDGCEVPQATSGSDPNGTFEAEQL